MLETYSTKLLLGKTPMSDRLILPLLTPVLGTYNTKLIEERLRYPIVLSYFLTLVLGTYSTLSLLTLVLGTYNTKPSMLRSSSMNPLRVIMLTLNLC